MAQRNAARLPKLGKRAALKERKSRSEAAYLPVPIASARAR